MRTCLAHLLQAAGPQLRVPGRPGRQGQHHTAVILRMPRSIWCAAAHHIQRHHQQLPRQFSAPMLSSFPMAAPCQPPQDKQHGAKKSTRSAKASATTSLQNLRTTSARTSSTSLWTFWQKALRASRSSSGTPAGAPSSLAHTAACELGDPPLRPMAASSTPR